MLRSCRWIVLASFVMALCGCSFSAMSTTQTPTGTTILLNGITYEIAGHPVTTTSSADDLHWKTDVVEVEVVNHDLWINGRRVAHVGTGDHVKVAADGTVTINGLTKPPL
jgi:hypothetical protein